MFPGDAEAATENMAIRNFNGEVKTTVLSGSHHGADTKGSNGSMRDVTSWTKSDWPDETLPEVIIYSQGLKHGHPRSQIVGNYHQSLARVPNHPFHCGDNNNDNIPAPLYSTFAEYSTEVSGIITVTTDGYSPLSIHCGGEVGCASEIEF